MQRVFHSLWKTRNEAIYTKEDSDNNKKRHNNLDQEITAIFHRLPNLRLLPQSEATFFNSGEERVKRYKLRRPPGRLQCKLRHSVQNYNKTLHQYLSQDKLEKQAKILKESSSFPLTQE